MDKNEFLRKARRDRGFTQFELSEQIGVSEMTIRRWENGESEPRASDIRRLSEALKVSEADLLYGLSEGEIEVTVKFYEEDFWEVSDMNLATNTPGAFLVSFGPSVIGIDTRGNWKTEGDVYMAFEIARTRAIEIFRLQKGWANGEISVPQIVEHEGKDDEISQFSCRPRRGISQHNAEDNDRGR